MPSHAEFAAGLRELADWYEAHPDIPLPDQKLSVYGFGAVKEGEAAHIVARALGTFEKEFSDRTDLFTLRRCFGPISLNFVFSRERVCVRRVVTREVEVEEWHCPPLLAPNEAA